MVRNTKQTLISLSLSGVIGYYLYNKLADAGLVIEHEKRTPADERTKIELNRFADAVVVEPIVEEPVVEMVAEEPVEIAVEETVEVATLFEEESVEEMEEPVVVVEESVIVEEPAIMLDETPVETVSLFDEVQTPIAETIEEPSLDLGLTNMFEEPKLDMTLEADNGISLDLDVLTTEEPVVEEVIEPELDLTLGGADIETPTLDLGGFDVTDEVSPTLDLGEISLEPQDIEMKLNASIASAMETAQIETEGMPEVTWTCACGATETGNFCQNCGAHKPEETIEEPMLNFEEPANDLGLEELNLDNIDVTTPELDTDTLFSAVNDEMPVMENVEPLHKVDDKDVSSKQEFKNIMDFFQTLA